MEDILESSNTYNHYEKSLFIQTTRFDEMLITKDDLKYRYDMWKGLKAWGDL